MITRSVNLLLIGILGGTAFCCAFALARENSTKAAIAADIAWSATGIPHIQAADERSLGYGIGYAYAQDNACLLENEIVTARGERAEFFGADGVSTAQIDNVHSDVLYRWLNSDVAVKEFWQAQPVAIQQRLLGYAAGFNRYLRGPQHNALSCAGAQWLRPIDEKDLVRLTRRLLVEGGLGQFAAALATTTPPGATANSISQAVGLAGFRDFSSSHGSNAIAVGGQRTENGKGRLLANPHFPWGGAQRFYQMHLTIPGSLDVMGAALPGLPVVNIGFNRNVAWTHTVDAASHFTLHRLQLDPKNPQQYVVDGKSYRLKKIPVTIKVRGRNGKFESHVHNVYESRYGPIVAIEGELDWTASQAYALQDANVANTRVLSQWQVMNAANSLAEFREAVQTIQGIPWVNTLAVDDRGQALYMDVSVIPNIPLDRLQDCLDQPLVEMGLPGVDGSRSHCDWQPDVAAAQPGIVSAARLPALQRKDFVQNSNDSAWMTNPSEPLTGFSPLVSRDSAPLSLRARFALEKLAKVPEATFSESFLRALVTDNHVYLADIVLDDLLAFCKAHVGKADVDRICTALAQWDRSANLDAGPGYIYFEAFSAEFLELEDAWRVAFDAGNPIYTPHGIAWQQPEVARQLKAILEGIAEKTRDLKITSKTRWGEIQGVTIGSSFIAIPGGAGVLGIYNAIESEPADSGRREVYSGSSYIQLVSFDAQGPVAKGLLSFSQASEPSSPHASDQTRLFSRQQWQPLPFTAEQIDADPPKRKLQLRE